MRSITTKEPQYTILRCWWCGEDDEYNINDFITCLHCESRIFIKSRVPIVKKVTAR